MSEALQSPERLFHEFDLREPTKGQLPGIHAEPLKSTEKKTGGVVNRILNALGFGDIYIQWTMPSPTIPLIEATQQYRVNVRSATKYINAHKDFLIAIGAMNDGEKKQASFSPDRIVQILTLIHAKTTSDLERNVLKQYGLLRGSFQLRAYVSALGLQMPEAGGSIAISKYIMSLPRNLGLGDIVFADFQQVKQSIEVKFFNDKVQNENLRSVISALKVGGIPEKGSDPAAISVFLDTFARKIHEHLSSLPPTLRRQFSAEKLQQADIAELTALENVLYYRSHMKELAQDWKEWTAKNKNNSSRRSIVDFVRHIRNYQEALTNPLLSKR